MSLLCREAFRETCILANGDVVCSCLDINGYKPLGNIKNQNIQDIFYGPNYQSLRTTLLDSSNDTYCPHLGINCYAKCIDYPIEGAYIDKIRLEISSYCNLRCPSCEVPKWKHDHPRLARLPIEYIRDVLDSTKSGLCNLWLYNYGEPFLDHRLLDILRLAKQTVPGIGIYIHTKPS